MWRDKRTGIWQTKLRGQQKSLETTKKTIAKKREETWKVNMGDENFGLRKRSKIIFYDLAKIYVEAMKDYRNDPKKFEAKKKMLQSTLEKHIYPEFSNIQIMNFTSNHVQKWADNLRITHAPDGVNRIVTRLRAIVKWGVYQDHPGIPFDPVKHWPRFKAPKDKWTLLTEEELQMIA